MKAWLVLFLTVVSIYVSSAARFVSQANELPFVSYGSLRNVGFWGMNAGYDARQPDGALRGINFSLLGIPFRRVSLNLVEDRRVAIGGYPIGLEMKVDGVLVDGVGSVVTDAGETVSKVDVRGGDIILSLNGRKILYIDDINDFMARQADGSEIRVTVNRYGNVFETKIKPVIEALTGRYRLGLWVRDSVTGIGTVSFVKADGSFACLGHGVTYGEYVLPCVGGRVYDCMLLGLTKGRRGAPGELKGMLNNTARPIGIITSNTKYGVFGKMSDVTMGETYKIGSMLNVNCGKAQIITTVGERPEFYNVEIIRALPQSAKDDKSMLLRVTDKRLISATGGIIQGMSGSPIVQNGVIIGVVTHVLVNDPLKGYGLYIDWMYQ